jgi:hypothetical protein
MGPSDEVSQNQNGDFLENGSNDFIKFRYFM